MDYVDTVVNTAELMWRLQSISPQMDIKLAGVKIWQTQPTGVPDTVGTDAPTMLSAVCDMLLPKTSGYDHVTVLTGTRYNG
ncbi:unnamed protein product [Sphagnum balticum]